MAKRTTRTGPPGEPTQIGSLLNILARRKKWDQHLHLHAVFAFWDEAVGAEIAGRAQPTLIRGQVLWLAVADSIWMQHLHLQKMLLLDIINQRLTADRLIDIRFKLKPLPARESPPRRAEPKKARPPDQKKLQEFETLTAALRQDEIKVALRRLWLKFQSGW